MNVLGESRTSTLRRLLGEVNDVVVVFLNFVVTNFAPFAVFVLLTRTFAIYGIDYLKPALVYVVVTVVLLFVFLPVAILWWWRWAQSRTPSPSLRRSPTWPSSASPPLPAQPLSP